MNRRLLAVISIATLILISLTVYYVGVSSERNVYEIEMYEFSYRVKDGGSSIVLKSGERYVFKVRNIGGAPHELMIVRDKDAVINNAHKMISRLMDRGLNGEALMEEFENMHHEMEEEMRNSGNLLYKIELAPGEEGNIEVSFSDPGIYYIICLELEGSYPKTHADMGMIEKIIVE